VLADVERDIGERLHAAERERHALDGEHAIADARGARVVRHGEAAQHVARVQRDRHQAAARVTGGKVFASTMRRSAATMPLRPSSNFTCVSMCCTARPS
jgi:hypothetical protein